MERSIRILQLSDLLIGGDTSTAADLDQLKHVITRHFGPSAADEKLRQIDYLVVCGNLTSKGLRTEFQAACEWLEDLIRSVIDPQHQELYGRAIVAPGVCDTSQKQGQRDFTCFNEFLSKLRVSLGGPEEGPRISAWDPIINELKDGTFIRVPYLEWADNAVGLDDLLERAAKTLGRFEYCRNTPTFLVSAASPVVNWKERLRLTPKGRGTAENHLRINFHLCGAGPVVIMPFEPFVFRHVGVSTGPRNPRDFWPLRANVVEVSTVTGYGGTASLERPVVSQQCRVVANSLESLTADWATDVWVGDDLFTFNQFSPEAAKTYWESHQQLERGLLEWLNGHQSELFQRLDHIPGSGIRECLMWLAQNENVFNGWTVIVKEIRSSRGEYDARRSDRLNEALEDTVIPSLRELKPRTLLILRDDSYIFQDPEDALGWVDRISDTVHNLVNGDARVLYLVTPRVTRDEFRGIPQLPVGPVSPHSSWEFAHRYQWLFPFEPAVVENLTGGALKLKEMLLRQGKEVFGSWSGADRVDAESACALIRKASSNPTMMFAYRDTTETVKRMDRGEQLLKVIELTLSSDDDPCRLNQLTMDLPSELLGLAELFLAQGLFARSAQGPYSLRAAGPFLYSDPPESEYEP